MKTRSLQHAIEVPAPPEKVFTLLLTPSAIRTWWSASRAIVVPQDGGLWLAAWGPEDDPEYVTSFKIRVLERPRLLVLSDPYYYAKSGPLPFKAKFLSAFTVEPAAQGSLLRVEQDGFPKDKVADEFYAACGTGWHKTFDGVVQFVKNGFRTNPVS